MCYMFVPRRSNTGRRQTKLNINSQDNIKTTFKALEAKTFTKLLSLKK